LPGGLSLRLATEVHEVSGFTVEPVRDGRRPVVSRILVSLTTEACPERLAQANELVDLGPLVYAPDRRVFRLTAGVDPSSACLRLRREPGVISAELLIPRRRPAKSVPNDPLFGLQWHWLNTGQTGGRPGVDINLTNVWRYYRGEGIRVGVVDDGLDYRHPDLAANCDVEWGWDYRDDDDDPAPEGEPGSGLQGQPKADAHGTAVAGLIAAAGNNGLGVTGGAYQARLVGIRLIGADTTDDQEAAALLHGGNVIHVSNNSWGNEDDGQSKGGAGPLVQKALEQGTKVGRNGLGTVYVWAAGNGGQLQDNANYDSYANSIYAITVGGILDDGRRAPYSEPGACLAVVAPAGDASSRDHRITSTDLPGEFGFNHSGFWDDLPDRDYTRAYGGTSAAVPMVSAVAALMLQTNPGLGWRDVQEVLLRSARMVDASNRGWFTNGAGFRFNHEYGAGLVDAEAAVSLARRWPGLGPQETFEIDSPGDPEDIPDGDLVGIVQAVRVTGAHLRLEQVCLVVTIEHPARGDLEISLISPAGTESRLAEMHGDRNPHYEAYAFTSRFHWGESSEGLWRVRIADPRSGQAGRLVRLSLKLHGSRVWLPREIGPALEWVVVGQASGSLRIFGRAGEAYVLERSADLKAWTPWWQTNAPTDIFEASVPLTGNIPAIFLRLRQSSR
jgi:subtilisin-like proprotein convertase family protein